MRKTGLAILVTLLLLATVTGVAMAITYGEPDTEHPYVGLVGFFDENGDWMWRCSGTLLSETVFLTAGHCTSGDYPDDPTHVPASAMIWFGEQIVLDPIYLDPANEELECGDAPPENMEWTEYPCRKGIPGTPHANPLYKGLYIPDTNDVGIVTIDGTIPDEYKTEFGLLPEIGFLDEIALELADHGTLVMSVGYGLQDVKPETISTRERYYSISFVISLTNALTDGFNIMTSNNPGKWPHDPMTKSGGSCFGDSGGPLFYTYEGTEYVVGITSFGMNPTCSGTGFYFRTDTASAQDFIYAER
ncbi:MAG: trypsin-like serine protease [Anaerolineales bacterium]|nr:trypsin-like serine protease [Anaerolineales bacterium]